MAQMFESLRHEEYPDAMPVREYQTETVSPGRDETVNLLIAEAEPGKWVGGYAVFWLNGRRSFLAPSLANGWFSSAREAKLFYLGFMAGYLKWFTPENRIAIRDLISRYSQSVLFE